MRRVRMRFWLWMMDVAFYLFGFGGRAYTFALLKAAACVEYEPIEECSEEEAPW